MSAVKLLLDRTKAGMQTLKQQHAIVVLDETFYAKAQEIAWKNQQEYSSIVLRMGVSHYPCLPCNHRRQTFCRLSIR